MISIEESIDIISEQTGINKGELRSSIEDWGIAMMSKGVIIDLRINRWRGKVSIEDTDIGLGADGDEWDYFKENYIEIGKKLVLPRRVVNALGAIESRARRNLEEYSFKTVWGHFVPCTVFQEWKVRDEEIKREYFEEAERFYREYDMIIEEVKEEYRVLARNIYNKGNISTPYDDFENTFINNISRYIMPAKNFLASFGYHAIYFYIPIPSEVQYEIQMATSFANETDALQNEMKMRKSIRDETVKMKSKYIEGFMEATAGKIRDMILTVVDEVKEGISVNNKSVKSAQYKKKMISMIEKVRSLDFYDDENVRDALDKLQLDLEKEAKFRSEDDIIESIEALEIAAKGNIFDMVSGRHKMLEFDDE